MLVITLCFIAGIALGIAQLGIHSNQQTYLPPGLQIADPSFLSHDWWLNNTRHYHALFFNLVAVLEKLAILQSGLILLNILCVALSLFCFYLVLKKFSDENGLLVFALFTSVFLGTNTFHSVGVSYLFSQSLQSSSIATLFTLAAMYYFLTERLTVAGVLLGVAGIFHTNYLLVNFVAFGFALLLLRFASVGDNRMDFRELVFGGFRLLGFSALVILLTLPLILEITTEQVDADTVEIARYAFFDFAVPHHYLPNTFIMEFWEMAGVSLLGFIWLKLAIPDSRLCIRVGVLLVSFAFIILVATLLTTVVFVEPVSRLFFWRLGPFLAALSMAVFITGAVNSIRHPDQLGFSRKILVAISSFLCVLMIVRYHQYQTGVFEFGAAIKIFSQTAILVFVFWSWLLVRKHRDNSATGARILIAATLVYLVVGFGFMLSTYDKRYTLFFRSPELVSKLELFEFVRDNTPVDSQFLIPPNLIAFRVLAARAVVVDNKALPFEKSTLAEWFKRLETVSGISRPTTFEQVNRGYLEMNSERLDTIMENYRITHVVMPVDGDVSSSRLSKLYQNHHFYLYAVD